MVLPRQHSHHTMLNDYIYTVGDDASHYEKQTTRCVNFSINFLLHLKNGWKEVKQKCNASIVYVMF